jgi:hypothetical protein
MIDVVGLGEVVWLFVEEEWIVVCGMVFELFSALSVKEMESSSVISSMDNTLK